MNKHLEDEPEDAGLIQSKPPTEKELREISRFIARSKQRHGARLEGDGDSLKRVPHQEKAWCVQQSLWDVSNRADDY